MRSELQIFREIRDWAIEWENIRAIVLDGSRADPSRTPDDLSDYDIAVLARDTGQLRDGSWLGTFGEPMVRWPLSPQPTFDPRWVTQLALFTDGVRIDFQFTVAGSGVRVERPADYFCVLIDKDGLADSLTPALPPGREAGPPSADDFADRLNAFWWDIPYVAKALRRGELDFAKYMLESNIRFEKLHPLIRWHIGIRHGWEVDVGIHGRWFRHYLDEATWEHYRETFGSSTAEDNWRALSATLSFTNLIGRQVARDLGYPYPEDVAANVSGYIRTIAPPAVPFT